MKITRKILENLIKEEVANALQEDDTKKKPKKKSSTVLDHIKNFYEVSRAADEAILRMLEAEIKQSLNAIKAKLQKAQKNED